MDWSGAAGCHSLDIPRDSERQEEETWNGGWTEYSCLQELNSGEPACLALIARNVVMGGWTKRSRRWGAGEVKDSVMEQV